MNKLVLLAICLILSACGGGDPDPATSPEQPPLVEQPSTPTPHDKGLPSRPDCPSKCG